ncbi:PAS domain-containing protein [Methylobacterium planeticum]|uniref:PAS domain-containing protein n=1 Tax=Methylobacterium planeticum TaxID=2615211 RepID=A0A6N6MU00_9HYPH|nr:PAS domain-containing protein [Methylobacterium planeticum]KAB1073222.1 PAS domain-containing protein [Methylobacterium planeticum]
MAKLKGILSRTGPDALQAALDASDVIGEWDWDISTNHVRSDPLVALLFSVDPELAEVGAPFTAFTDRIHEEDRERVTRLIGECALAGGSYVAEYRVCSADGVTRWVLTRGHFELDARGGPWRGRGITIDITPTRMSDHAYVRSGTTVSGHPLERAANHCVAAHKALQEIEEPHLNLLSEMLLLEVGRKLAQLEGTRRRKGMN